MSSGGGGDGGASRRQAEQEAQKQVARDRLNLLFGEAPQGITLKALEDGSGGKKYVPDFVPGPAPVAQQSRWGGGNLFGGIPTTNPAELSQAAEDAAQNKTAREKLYGDIRGNAFTAGKRSIDEQTGDAKRNLKFELFAKGLNGGSTDIDQNARLQRTYDTGILSLGARADGAAADVRSNDESTRLGLLQSIDAGLDQGSAISSAMAQLRANSDKAAAGATQTTVDDLFGNAGLLYQNSRRAMGEADARDAALYGSGGARKPKAYTGTITPTGA